MRFFLALSALMLAPTASGQLTEADRKSIQTLVTTSQTAGLVKRDLQTYLAAFDSEAEWVLTRGPDRTPKDTVLDRRAGQARAEVRAIMGGPAPELTFDKLELKERGEAVELRMVATIIMDGYVEQVGELYRLRRRGDRWKITENRTWPVMTAVGIDVTWYSEAKWRTLDQEVKSARARQNGALLIVALRNAWRLREAEKQAEIETNKPNAPAFVWAMRVDAEYAVGDIKEALMAARKARQLDPKIQLPPWVDKL